MATPSQSSIRAVPANVDIRARSNLSNNQFLMWLGQLITPDVPLYNMVQTFVIEGDLDPNAFAAALQSLVDASDALSTTVDVVDGVPQQRVSESMPARLDWIDFSGTAAPQRAYEEWLAERKGRLLTLRESLFDSALVKLGERHHVWYLCQHHLITDGRSFALTFEYMAARYALAVQGRLSDAPDLPAYADYVIQEKASRGSDAWQGAADFWQRQLEDDVSGPLFYGRQATSRDSRTERLVLQLGAERSLALREIAGADEFATLSLNLSLYSLWMTLLTATVHRITGENDLRIGAPFEARPTPEQKRTIGLFIEIGVLNARVQKGDTFVSLFQRLLEQAFSGLRNIRAGISDAEINRSYSVMLNYVTSKFDDFAGMPVATDWIHTGYGDEAHALRLQVCDFDDTGQFTLLIDVDVNVFDCVHRHWLVDDFNAVIDAFLQDPQRSIGSFDLLTPNRRQQLAEFNRTAERFDARSVVLLFEDRVKSDPEALAAAHNDRRMTYAALNVRANQFAVYLAGIGVASGDRVAICMPRSLDVLVAIWGVLKAGAAFVPIDPAFPDRRKSELLSDLAPAAIVCLDATDVRPESDFDGELVVMDEVELTHLSTANPDRHPAGDDLAYLIYTSGSTGRPKAAMLSHEGLANYVVWARETYLGSERLDFALYSSLAFDLTLTSVFVPAAAGAAVKIYSEDDSAPGLEILRVFSDDAVDVVKLTPAHLDLLKSHPIHCGRIRKLILGGEDLKTRLVCSLLEKVEWLPEIYNEYGPTEATIGCMVHRFDPKNDRGTSVPIGVPAANMQIHLRDAYGQPVPDGVVGEMVIAGPGVALGYWQRSELTSAQFLVDDATGLRAYRSGDLARWDENGRLQFLGRRDDQVKIRGVRVELGEVEAGLLEHPDVMAAAAKNWAQRLVGYYVSKHELGYRDLKEHMSARVPDFLVPASFVHLDKLPLTRNGKIDRAALPEPGSMRRELATRYVAPATAEERELASIWSAVLDVARVGVRDNYFDLGGDSVMSIQIAALAQERALQITPKQLFLHPTIAELTAAILADAPSTDETVPDADEYSIGQNDIDRIRRQIGDQAFANVKDIYPLTPVQAGLLYHCTAAPDAGFYVGQVSCTLAGEVNADLLRAAWQDMVARHPALRTRIFWQDLDQPLQVVFASIEPVWELIDWREKPTVEITDELERLETRLFERGINLHSPEMMRLALVLLPDGRAQCIWTVHHILLDGWSAYPLFSEWLSLYTGLHDGRAVSLRSRRAYRDYVSWQGCQDREPAEQFWRQYLAGFRQATSLPIGRRRTADVPSSERCEMTFSKALSDDLRTLSKRNRTTLNCVFQAAWAILLSRYCRQDDVVFGATVSGRNVDLAEVDSMIGLFLNTLPVRSQPDPGKTVHSFLRETQDSMLAISDYEASSLASIQRLSELAPDQPLFDSIVVFENYPARIDNSAGILQISALRFNAPSHYPLALLVYPEEPIKVVLIYSSLAIGQSRVAAMTRHLHNVLEAMARDAGQLLGELSIIDDLEYASIHKRANTAANRAATPPSVPVRVSAAAAGTPKAAALRSGSRVVSYAELQARSDHLAERLLALDVAAGDFVAVEAARTIEAVTAILGVWKAGAAFVPIDPAYPEERTKTVLAETAASVALTEPETRIDWPASMRRVDASEFRHGNRPGPGLPQPDVSLPAYVLYTSGSTGRPKGVLVSHQNLAHSTNARVNVYPAGVDRFLLLSPLAFDSSLAGLCWTLATGGELVLPEPGRETDPAHLLDIIQSRKITQMLALPSLYRALLEGAKAGQMQSIKTVIVAGEACPPDLFDAHRDTCLNAALHNEYGPTEATVWSHVYSFPPDFADSSVPIGKPLDHVSQFVLDHHQRPVPLGIPGELVLGGQSIAQGYLGQADLTDSRFIQLPELTPASKRSRFYRTGDLVRMLADGDLEFLGRIDEQLKIRGFRVEPAEIEGVLCAHPEISMAAIYPLAGSSGAKSLVAVYSAAKPLPEGSLGEWVKERLPTYMAPDNFVHVDNVPLLPNGKVDRKKLSSDILLARGSREYAAPDTPVQAELAEIWAEVLGAKRVGIDDNFLDLGGDSIAAIRVAAQAHRAGLSIAPRLIIENTSIRKLSATLESSDARREQPADNIPEKFSLTKLSDEELDDLLEDLDN